VAYTDTSVIVAALDPSDPRCRKARRLLEDGGYRVVSELTLVELASAVSRRGELLSSLAGAIGADEELTLSAALLYLLKRFNLRYRPLEQRRGFR
jgi:predicted nucleic acid-binding protein